MVDDEATLSELVGMGLPMAGWSVAADDDGPGAVKLVEQFRSDVLILVVCCRVSTELNCWAESVNPTRAKSRAPVKRQN